MILFRFEIHIFKKNILRLEFPICIIQVNNSPFSIFSVKRKVKYLYLLIFLWNMISEYSPAPSFSRNYEVGCEKYASFLLNWALLWVVCLIKVPSTTILVKEKEKKAWPQLLTKFYAILNFSKGSLINLFVQKLWIKNYTVHVSLKGSQKGVESSSFLCSKAKYSTTGKTKGRKQKLRGKRKVLW